MKQQPKKVRNIQSILSRYFILLIVLMLGIVTVFFSVIQYRTLRSRTEATLDDLCLSVSDNIDLQISEMNTIALSCISSSDLKDSVQSYVADTDLSSYDRTLLRKHISALLTSLKGFDYSIRQLNIYGVDGTGIGTGALNGLLPYLSLDMDWYDAVTDAAGRAYIEVSAAAADGSESDTLYLSLYHLYYDDYHRAAGITEVRKYYDQVFSNAINPSEESGMQIYVFREDGSLLYPADADGEAVSVYFEEAASGSHNRRGPSGKMEYICYGTASKSSLLVAAVSAHERFMRPVWRSLAGIFIIFLSIFALCLLISSYLSRKISSPIRHIYHFLSNDRIGPFEPLVMDDTGIREIDRLKQSINTSRQAHQQAQTTMLTLKEKEVQAQMLALQAQMNPHFLYNSLSNIAEMAQEGMTDEVASMARAISEILRYISSNREQRICLEEELELTSLYLECIRMRFGEQLEYKFDVADEMLEMEVPKLCVQLLVENAIKATTSVSPPWRIRITGRITPAEDGPDRWSLSVEDSGPGFDPEVDRHLRRQMDEILESGILPGLQIEGMGILNIFIRLYLLDGPKFIFDFGSREEGGAYVLIGGYMPDVSGPV